MSRQSFRVAMLAASEKLAAVGVPSPTNDAELLAAHVLGVPRTHLGLTPLVDSGVIDQFDALVARRAQRIPLQHILGTAVLGQAVVRVGVGVFTPRPETELLVEWGLAELADRSKPLVVDLCAGSGAIAVAVALARPDARVVAVERSPAALAWARRNAETHQAAGGTPIDLRGADINDERALADLAGKCDLVLANPPYVPTGAQVQPEVRDFDPPEAVFAGDDGLDVIRPLVFIAATLLKTGGVLAIEHDDSHGETVPELLRRRRVLADVADHPDLAGRPRFVTATRVGLS